MLRQCWKDLGIAAELIVERGLPEFAEPDRLVVAETSDDGREHLLIPEAADAWRIMQAAAAKDGVVLRLVSAFRSVERQIEIISNKLRNGQEPDEIFLVSAPPGCSEHHSGRAVDIGTTDSPPLETEFELTAAYRWLAENAGRFGFTLSFPRGNRWGYSYEPWHWCFDGSAKSHSEAD